MTVQVRSTTGSYAGIHVPGTINLVNYIGIGHPVVPPTRALHLADRFEAGEVIVERSSCPRMTLYSWPSVCPKPGCLQLRLVQAVRRGSSCDGTTRRWLASKVSKLERSSRSVACDSAVKDRLPPFYGPLDQPPRKGASRGT